MPIIRFIPFDFGFSAIPVRTFSTIGQRFASRIENGIAATPRAAPRLFARWRLDDDGRLICDWSEH